MSLPENRSLLLLILDLTPAVWGLCSTEEFALPNCIEAALGFANSHLMLSSLNELAVIGVTPNCTSFIYPSHEEAVIETSRDGQYDALSSMNCIVRRLCLKLVLSCNSSATQVILASAIIKSLCYYLRRCRELQPVSRQLEDVPNETTQSEATEKISARILIIKAASDSPSQYLSLMNAVFTSQKLHVPIDTCVLPLSATKVITNDKHCSTLKHPSLLQQAADLTGGIYLHIPRTSALLQYLLSVFLSTCNLRSCLLLPDSRSGGFCGVDFRAACFCHKRLIDIGYVCSVCLSVFCEFTPICSTCNSPFIVPRVKSL